MLTFSKREKMSSVFDVSDTSDCSRMEGVSKMRIAYMYANRLPILLVACLHCCGREGKAVNIYV